jgi:hypothetical protein
MTRPRTIEGDSPMTRQTTQGSAASQTSQTSQTLGAAGVGCTCLAVACLMVAGEFAAEGARGFARYSRITGAGFLAGFVAVATGAGAVWANPAFVAAVAMVLAWTSVLPARLYRRTARTASTARTAAGPGAAG